MVSWVGGWVGVMWWVGGVGCPKILLAGRFGPWLCMGCMFELPRVNFCRLGSAEVLDLEAPAHLHLATNKRFQRVNTRP